MEGGREGWREGEREAGRQAGRQARRQRGRDGAGSYLGHLDPVRRDVVELHVGGDHLHGWRCNNHGLN